MRRLVRIACVAALAGGALLVGAPADAQTATAGQILISEFRVRGPNGANDEFIEIYNNIGADHTVVAASGTGYGVAASDGTTRCTIPNGTVIPAGGHYLCTNSVGYSLGVSAATARLPPATRPTRRTSRTTPASRSSTTTPAAAATASRTGSTPWARRARRTPLYKEGRGYPALTPFSIDYSWLRDECGKGGAVNLLGTCTISTPKDTDTNSIDFYFVDTNGTSAGGGQRLGAPGPQNLSAPLLRNSTIPTALLDTCVASSAVPNRVRDFTSDPANNSTFGTLDIRRTFTNNTGGSVTRLRFRVIDLDTFPAASGFADLRPRTSTSLVVTVDRPPCGSGRRASR